MPTPEELAQKVIEVVERLKSSAKAVHDYLILPSQNSTPASLKSLFDDPKALLAAMIRGGWIVPFHPDRSMFLLSIVGAGTNRGPMEGVLTAEEIEKFNAWIAAGAVIPSGA